MVTAFDSKFNKAHKLGSVDLFHQPLYRTFQLPKPQIEVKNNKRKGKRPFEKTKMLFWAEWVTLQKPFYFVTSP